MIEARAIIQAVEDSTLRVQALNPGNCPRCAEGRGCGGGILSRLTQRQRPDVRVARRDGDYRVGDVVILGIDESDLLQVSTWVYLVPLGAMLGAGVVADQLLGAPDLVVTALAIGGLALGLGWLRRHAAQAEADGRFRPVVLRKDNAAADTCARLG